MEEGLRLVLKGRQRPPPEKFHFPTFGDGGLNPEFRDASWVVVGARYAALPAALEQQMTFALGTDVGGTPLNPLTLPWPALNNRRITLSFVPSTAADASAIQSLLPQAPTAPSQFPFSVPAYLFQVTPQLKLEDQVIATGSPMSLGAELGFVFTPTLVDRGDSPNTYQVVAGSYLSVAVVAGTVSRAR